MRYKETAKAKLEGFWGTAIAATLIYILVQSIPNGVNVLGDNATFFGSIIAVLVIPITVGYHRFYLLHAQNKPA
ncbi:MAG: hypothetical protein UMR38_06155 [Candidatus Izemoplasma sp.]|nr:hypothetical protein [Candidatus Izemoplasma sp.]